MRHRAAWSAFASALAAAVPAHAQTAVMAARGDDAAEHLAPVSVTARPEPTDRRTTLLIESTEPTTVQMTPATYLGGFVPPDCRTPCRLRVVPGPYDLINTRARGGTWRSRLVVVDATRTRVRLQPPEDRAVLFLFIVTGGAMFTGGFAALVASAPVCATLAGSCGMQAFGATSMLLGVGVAVASFAVARAIAGRAEVRAERVARVTPVLLPGGAGASVRVMF